MKRFFMKILVFFALKCRIYYIWSRLYRILLESQYRKDKLPVYDDIDRLHETLRGMTWVRDTSLQLWDAVSYPTATYYRDLHGEGAGDCDDISMFAITCIAVMNANGVELSSVIKRPIIGSEGMMSCPCIKSDGTIGGHNVGIFEYIDKNGNRRWAHVSNWHKSRLQLNFVSKEAIARHVVESMAGKSLGWAICDINLKLREYHWRLK